MSGGGRNPLTENTEKIKYSRGMKRFILNANSKSCTHRAERNPLAKTLNITDRLFVSRVGVV